MQSIAPRNLVDATGADASGANTVGAEVRTGS